MTPASPVATLQGSQLMGSAVPTLPPECFPPLGPSRKPLQAEPGKTPRETHVGLGAGGLDMQDIRKSFFLLDFPEMERR